LSREAGTLEQLARLLGDALQPLEQHLAAERAPGLFEALGIRLPAGAIGNSGLAAALNATAAAAGQLGPAVAALAAALNGNDPVAIIQRGIEVIQRIGAVITGIGQIRGAVAAIAASLPPVQRAHIEAAITKLPTRLVNFLLVEWIESKAPGLAPAFALTGVLDDVPEPGIPGNPVAPPFARRELRLDRLIALVSDPRQHLADRFGWGTPGFDGIELLTRLKRFVDEPDLEVTLITAPGLPAILEGWAFRLAVDPSLSPPGLALRVRQAATIDTAHTLELLPPWSLRMTTAGRFEAGIETTIRPDGRLAIKPPSGDARLNLEAALLAGDGATPMVLLGQAGTSRIEMTQFKLGVALAAEWDPAAGEARGVPVVSLAIKDGKAAIDTSEGDSFLRFLTGGLKGESHVSLAATWSPEKGLKLDGSSAIEVAIPTHATIGPVTLEAVYVRAGIAPGGKIPVELSAAIGGQLGPLGVSVDRIGVLLEGSFPDEGGNLGPLDIDVGFKPPNGIGLRVDGGGFRGGGFLYLDPAKGEYAGALELSFQGVVDLKAVGVLNTRMPDGSAGFSLVIVISAEFAPIQLSFGFTLLGVGGLLGLNRTIIFDVLRGGIRDGSLNSILFPRDVVANAPRIIGDLKRVFPPLGGRFLIGPMAKLGWGTPTLVSLELGLFLEIPRPAFAIAGVLRVTVPTPDAALIRIQVNFLGVVDFDKRQLSFDAALYDSYLVFMPLTGDMAVRLYWGENGNFLLTVGGFHPSYTPPSMGLGPLERVSIQIFRGLPDIRAQVYVAVTANTIQFGGKLELKAGVRAFNVYGFLAADVLIQRDPFHFIADISAMLAVRTGSTVLFSVRLHLMLEGPAPLHARGRASFEIGFIFTITISVKFDVTIGDPLSLLLPPLRLLPLIADALRDDRAWQALLPALHAPQVALRDFTGEAGIIFHPAGVLAARQLIAPMNLPLARVGAQRLEGGNRFAITEVRVGGEIVETTSVREQFAPAQFLDMSDGEKLSSQSFAGFDAGMQIKGGGAPKTDFVRKLDVVYEIIYLDRKARGLFFKLARFVLDALILGSAAAKSGLGATKNAATGLGTAKVVVAAESFAVVTTRDLTLADGNAVFSTQAEARAAMNAMAANDPEGAARLQVVPGYEVAA
jgi:hypothetical protein